MQFHMAASTFDRHNVLFVVENEHTRKHYGIGESAEDVFKAYAEYAEHFNGTLDAGLDVFTSEEVVVPAGEDTPSFLPLGMRARLHMDGVPTAFDLYQRSSTRLKTKLRHTNPPGLVDAGYRNVISALVLNEGKEDAVVSQDSRLFQFVAYNKRPIFVVLVDELPETQRSLGGFGSTGV